MRRIFSPEDEMNSMVTFEFEDGQCLTVDRHALEMYGVAEIARQYGVKVPTGRVPVKRGGRQIGTLPASFDPYFAKSLSIFYDIRRDDFTWRGGHWEAAAGLGSGDLEAVPGFVWTRGTA